MNVHWLGEGPSSLWVRCAYVIAYVSLLGFVASHHEMWRDEVQVWLIVRESASHNDLMQNIEYEGHPLLWYSVIWLLQPLVDELHVLQLANLAFVTIAVWFLLRLERLPKLFRYLLPLTYLFVYEYGTIARNYSIGIACLIIALFCALERRAAVIAYGFLAFAALTSVYGAVLAMAIGGSWLFLDRVDHDGGGSKETLFRSRLQRGSLVALLGLIVVIAALTCIPPADSVVKPDYALSWDRIEEVIAEFLRGTFLVPNVLDFRWNDHHLLDSIGTHASNQTRLGLAFVLTVAFLSRRSPVLLGYWALSVVGLGAVGVVTGKFEYWRHTGHAALAFTFWFVMSCYQSSHMGLERWAARAAVGALAAAFLLANLLGTVPAIVADTTRSFSYGPEAALFIRKRFDPDDVLVLGYSDAWVSSVHASAPEYKFIYLNSGVAGGFVRWGSVRKYSHTLSPRQIVAAAEEFGCKGDPSKRRILVSHVDVLALATLEDAQYHAILTNQQRKGLTENAAIQMANREFNMQKATGNLPSVRNGRLRPGMWIDEETKQKYKLSTIQSFSGSLSGDEDVFIFGFECPQVR